MPRLRSSTQAHLPVHIAIIGGGLAGITTALALTRVGHRVTVFEQHAEDAPLSSGGVRIPPNQSKVLYRWGLKEALSKIAVISRALRFYTYGQGEWLGGHSWDEEILKETGGDWMFTTYADLRTLLLEAARANGANFRFGTRVEAVDEDEATLALASGESFSASVIVGADGSKSVMRDMLFEGEEETQETGLAVFNMTVPLEKLEADPQLRELLELSPVSLWMGDGIHAHGFPMTACGLYALHFYVPHPSADIPDRWDAPPVSPSVFLASIGNAEPRLRALAALASPPSAVRYQRHQELEDEDDWLLPSSLGVVLGDARGPSPPASIQASAMVFEDAAVFAKLFSHMRRPDQVPSLLQAYASLRAERVRQVLEGDVSNIMYLTMPYDESGVATTRDENMRQATKAGKSVLGGDSSDASANEQWEQILSTWGYDAEDEADNWWVEWGALGERAQEAPRALAFDFSSAIGTSTVNVKSIEIEAGA